LHRFLDETGLKQARVSLSRALPSHDQHLPLNLEPKCSKWAVLGTERAICP
jgi:hypothetical protein